MEKDLTNSIFASGRYIGKQFYSRRQIKNDQPGSHDFRRFLRQFWADFLEISQRPFSIEILTRVKISQNNIKYFKS